MIEEEQEPAELEHTESEEIEPQDAEPQDPEAQNTGPERTGVEEVDAVLDSLRTLDDRPVEEHPAVFEQAHERLRQALDSPAGA